MANANRLSVVLPVRDGEDRIESRVAGVLDLLEELVSDPEDAEVVIVDDGSRDLTAAVLDDLAVDHPQIRVVRHSRPRGMEAAGQTGLERATGDLVFIQESDADIRIDDMRRLYRMSHDKTVVAARAHSRPRSVSAELMRRLKAWGAPADAASAEASSAESQSLQMIRRPQLQKLVKPNAKPYKLESETLHSVEPSS